MSGSTSPVVLGPTALASSTTPSADSERQEQAVIAQLLEQVDASRNTFGISSARPRKVLRIAGLELAPPPASPSSLEQVEGSESLTQADMKQLAAANGRRLIAHINSGVMRPAQLAFAAELLGEAREPIAAERALHLLLKHRSSLVREGAVYGLAKLGTSSAVAALQHIAQNDPSPGVREAAIEALDD